MFGVRPAAHISLQSLASNAGYSISASLASAATDRAQIDKSSSLYIINSNEDQTFTFTPKSNYYINSITIGATDGSPAQVNITIQASAPSSYSTLGSSACTYKVYRSGNTVKVIINKATEAISIVGNAAGNLTVTGGANITNLGFTRATCSSTSASLSATFGSGFYPQFSYNGGSQIKISAAAGSGGIGSVAYSYTFTANTLNMTFTGLSTGYTAIPTIALTTHTLGSYNLTVNVSNAIYEIVYESTQTIINVTPSAGYYVTQAYVGSNAPEDVKYYMGVLTKTGNAHSVVYHANDESSKVIFVLRDVKGDLTLNVVLGNTKPILEMASGGSSVNGVAIQSRLSGSSGTLACLGDVRINGYSSYDGLDYVHISATESKGFRFAYWEIDGTALDFATYGYSANIPLDLVEGKIITAVFVVNNSGTNSDTETDDAGGFV